MSYELDRQRDYYACVSNEIIQKSFFSLTAQQFDLLFYVLSMVRKEDEPGKIYSFTLKEFCEVSNKDYSNGWYYVTIKKDLKAIRDTSVYVPIEPSKNRRKREHLVAWFNKVIVDEGGNFSVRFDETIYPHIYNLIDKYTMASRKYVLPLPTFYAKRLYLLLRSYLITPKEYLKDIDRYEISEQEHNNRYTVTQTFEVEELRKKLYVDRYSKYYDFRRYVLDTAIEDINKYTDIDVSLDGKTSKGSGRTITHIKFTIKLIRWDIEREKNRYIYFNGEDIE